jgi:hypothetical protein
MNVTRRTALRRPLAVVVLWAGLTLAGCANNAGNPPATPSTSPPGPVVSSTPPAQSQPAVGLWVTSMCQALRPALAQLGTPPQVDMGNSAAARQAYIDYLGRAANAAQQATDRLASIGAPPVQNGQQILDQLRTQLTQLRNNLNDALTQLKAANPNEAAAIGSAFGAAGNAVGLLSTLTSDPQLRDAIDQAPECQNTPGVNATPSTTSPSPPPS